MVTEQGMKDSFVFMVVIEILQYGIILNNMDESLIYHFDIGDIFDFTIR